MRLKGAINNKVDKERCIIGIRLLPCLEFCSILFKVNIDISSLIFSYNFVAPLCGFYTALRWF